MAKKIDIKNLKGITQDSRAVKAGYLFAAFPGSKADGRDYIADAIRNGAAFILAATGVMLPDDIKAEVTLITDNHPRKRFAHMAAEFYGRQPEHIVAVTGTSGKTSTVHFVKHLWQMRDIKAASLGTLGLRAPDMVRSGSMTTPDSVSLHAELADLAAAGVTHLAMEASSHGLDQHRLDGVKIETAGFTNFSREHLEYHNDMEEYFSAKLRLFSEVMQPGGTVVLNADIDEYESLEKLCKEGGHAILSYGFKGRDLRILDIMPAPHGQAIQAEIFGKKAEINLPLVGNFQVMNAFCALGLALAGDRDYKEEYLRAFETLQGAPGRLQFVGGHPEGAAVYVDYAHKADALEKVLTALRAHTTNRLICVFGCGGDRDAGKRPLMGRIANDLADQVIVTDDNPRTEDPAKIRADILAAAPGAKEMGGRREAIKTAIAGLRGGDVLVIAGKGHEQGQIFADRREPFDDVEEAKKAIEELV